LIDIQAQYKKDFIKSPTVSNNKFQKFFHKITTKAKIQRKVPEILTKFVSLAKTQYKRRTQFSTSLLIQYLTQREPANIQRLKTKQSLIQRQKFIYYKRLSPLLLKFPKLVRLLVKKFRLEQKRKRIKRRKENRLSFIAKHAKFQTTVKYYFRKFKLKNAKLGLRLRKQLKNLSFLLQKRKLTLLKLNKVKNYPVFTSVKKAKPFLQMKKKERTRFLFEKERKIKKTLVPFFAAQLVKEKKTFRGNFITRRVFRQRFWKKMKKMPRFITRAILRSKKRQFRASRSGFFFDVLRQMQIVKAKISSEAFSEKELLLQYFDLFSTGLSFKRYLGVYKRDKKIDLHDLVKNLIGYAYPRRDPNLRRKEKERRRQPRVLTQLKDNKYFSQFNQGRIKSAKKFLLNEVYKKKRNQGRFYKKTQLYNFIQIQKENNNLLNI